MSRVIHQTCGEIEVFQTSERKIKHFGVANKFVRHYERWLHFLLDTDCREMPLLAFKKHMGGQEKQCVEKRACG